MTIISTLSSILDNRVASEANWVKINEIAATAASEFEYRRLVASLRRQPRGRPQDRNRRESRDLEIPRS